MKHIERQIEIIKEEIQHSLIENFGTGKAPHRKDITESLLNSLSSLANHQKIDKGSRVATNLLWNKWNESQQKTWTFCNVDFPEIGETTRLNIQKLNSIFALEAQKAEDQGFEVDDVQHIKVPWWAVWNPKEILIVDVHLKPIQALDFVTLNFVMEDGKNA